MRVLSIFGTRPEAIKMAPVVLRLSADPEIESIVCTTGQHRQMLDQMLGAFGVTPDVDLGVMTQGQSLNALTGQILTTLDGVLEQTKPDRVLVHGDTATAMAASLAAFHRRIPVGHVEAGLRTYDLQKPWPEEMNRRFVDIVSDLMFAPTEGSRENLAGERLGGRVFVTGNTVIDALHHAQAILARNAAMRARIDAALPRIDPAKRLVLVTGHRRESFGDGFRDICAALLRLAERSDVEIIYPVHLNPNVREPVMQALGGRDNIHLIAPQDYFPFVRLMQRADVILTDSGGVQEEAPALGKPVLVMRDVTERPEAVAAGAAELVGTAPDSIVAAVTRVLDEEAVRLAFARGRSPYGDGRAADRIASALLGVPFDEFDMASPSQTAVMERLSA
ncbi:non-hydrolyzing UDP-N-acetylglucosamine 2-epimerase [Caulobacter mirabilis]|uniref:UDP-N-acetylglucosamine 2-epimerase (non-hydrolyzing) n=1 Tax=Caulobacter mirabilis TaxID=69666 RepID=A0A2D2B187_9CAUL|nr:UDP-N-acetylglucosamine 2-epimerase (non-hydrolyzing) [Caulobacter mirabilis]